MNQPPEPRPSRFLLAATWFVLIESAVWFAILLTTWIRYFGYDHLYAKIVWLPPVMFPLTLGILQFFAVYRKRRIPGEWSGRFLIILGLLWVFVFVASGVPIAAAALNRQALIDFACGVHGLLLIACGVITLQRCKELSIVASNRDASSSLFQFSLQELLGLTFFVSLIAGITTALLQRS